MGRDREGAIRVWREFEQAFDRSVERHQGWRLALVLMASGLAEFPTALQALCCAVEMQRELATREKTDAAWREVHVRVGVRDNVLLPGPGANGYQSERLLTPSPPGGICLSKIAHGQVASQLGQLDGTADENGRQGRLLRDIGRIWDELVLTDDDLVTISASALARRSGFSGS